METIYDHDISDHELMVLDKMTPGRVIDNNKQNYLSSCSQDILFADLFRLYNLRGDIIKADYYFEKIQDNTLTYLLKSI